jgi:hypothetical protein
LEIDFSRFQATFLSFFASFSLTFPVRLLRLSEKNLRHPPEVELADSVGLEVGSVGPEVGSVEPEMESVDRDIFQDKVVS